ncbi:type II secretion system F family protein [Candidatus Babeliales bacterium]|nr:type II secretion system F family protein [Candidatus Babeliales bacterium]
MPIFNYKAKNKEGSDIIGKIEAININVASKILSERGLTVVNLKRKRRIKFFDKYFGKFFNRIPVKDLLFFLRELSVLISANIPLIQSLHIIEKQIENKMLRGVILEVADDVEGGSKLSDSLGRFPDIFDSFYINIIKSGETSGKLDEVLNYLTEEEEKNYDMMKKIKGAMIYPAFIFTSLIVVGIVMMVFVVPKLTKVFTQSNLELPWTTQLVIKMSSFISGNIYLIICFLIAASLSFLYFRKKKKVQNIISEIFFKIPFVSELYIKIILARFIRTLGTLLSSGINILKALDISAETVGYNKYHKAIKELSKEIGRGVSISNAMRKRQDLFPYMLINMVSVGEKTGNLDSILNELAIFYEEEVDNSIKNLISLIEPLLLLIMGLIVAAIAFSVITPIYQLVGSIN